jgi:flavin reductase (DIM6/NTAB) family NADH-FMN oxidoreductase RutF
LSVTTPDSFLTARPGDLSPRERYQLLTSLVVPRPIGWISTRSPEGVANLAPFSYFAALSANPLLVGVSIGLRRGEPKDTLRNIRASGAFCVNVVPERLLEKMNASSGEYPPEVDELALVGLTAVQAGEVDAPWVGEAPAALECAVFREVELGEAPNVLVIGEVKAAHLSRALELVPGTWAVEPRSLRPVGRLGGDRYTLLGEVRDIPRPK